MVQITYIPLDLFCVGTTVRGIETQVAVRSVLRAVNVYLYS